jgi:type I restriction enzyme S subunit
VAKMSESVQKPRIRFKGFSDAWEQRKLEDFFTERNERSGNGEMISVTIGSGIKKFDELNRFDKKPDDLSKYKRVEVGDIAYNSMRMWQGASGYSPYSGILSPAYTVITPKNGVSSRFFAYVLKQPKMIHQFEINSQGLTKDTWNLKFPAFAPIEVVAPLQLAEQEKVSELLLQLDNLITLHQRKYDKLVDVKKALLEKMFPADGETVPKIRFKGFSDAWEQRKLGDTVQITMGQSPDGSTYSDVPSDYILVQGNADLQNGWVSPRLWTSQMTKKADAGDLIMSVRAPAGAMGKTAYNAVIGRGVAAIKGNEFIYQLLVKMDSDGYWKALSCGSTFESLNSDNIKNADVLIPNAAEQKKIGQYFANLDNLITLHQRQLEKLKNIKSALLEKMFV